jgi:hypothetical protein
MSEAQAIEDDVQDLQARHEAGQDTGPLVARLNAQIAEFLARGDTIEWIEAEHDSLVRLFLESGEDVVSLDPDPEVDRAWYGQIEVRACPHEGLWIFRKGRFGHLSGHAVT